MLKYYKTAPVSQSRITPLQLQDVQVQVYGDVAVMTGIATGTSAAGKPAGNSVRFTRVNVKRQGQWIVVASHLSRVESLTQAKTN
jgi:ketosteroid isomerase-like protein